MTPDYLQLAISDARAFAASVAEQVPTPVVMSAGAPAPTIEHLTITRDVLPHHYIARARILDLTPEMMVPAISATMAAVREQYPHAERTGWIARCDGLTLYLYAWTCGADRHWQDADPR